MRVYRHRVNTVAELEAVAPTMGIELDLRSSGDRVIVTHDPFTEGPTIEEYFPHIGGRPCIFNVKCEGIEARVRDLAAQSGVVDYFMLDLSVPAAVKLARASDTRMAVRFSELEPAAGALAWKGRASWLWVDCFERFPVEEPTWSELAASLPEIPDYLPGARRLDRAELHQMKLFLLFNHASGFFAGAETQFYWQHNAAESAGLRDDSFYQVNLLAGYRFKGQRGEIAIGGLNLTGENYHLNPVNLYTELPRERVFYASLRLRF